MTLTEFLLARIAEDEDHARWAQEGIDNQARLGIVLATALTHPDAMSPARVLAECEAKRRLVELHDKPHEHPCGRLEWIGYRATERVEEDHGCRTLGLLALPYADHDDYRDEWRP